MGWVGGIPISAGVLNGQSFNSNSGSVSGVTWDVAPNDTPDGYLNFFRGDGDDWGEHGIYTTIDAMNDGDKLLFAGIDIEPASSSPYVKSQLRISIYKVNANNFDINIEVRNWTDASTYTDTTIQSTINTITYYTGNVVDICLFYVVTSYAGESHVFIGVTTIHNWGSAQNEYRIIGYCNSYTNFISIIKGTTPEKETSPEFGPASLPDGGYNPEGGHGTFDDSSDTIPVPALPSVGVTTAGFINVYKVEQGDLATLGEKLFPHFLPAEILADPSQLSIQEVLTWFVKIAYGTLMSPVGTAIEINDNLGIFDILMNGKLIDYILDCHIIPTSISGSTISPLRVGYRTFNDLQLAKCNTDYVEVDCGSLSLGEYWGNFLDYSCRVKLFLPMVGFVPIDNEYWNGGTIKVVYHVNIVDGSFQAYIIATSSKSKLTDTVIGQYGGVCCVHLPITGLQYSNVVAGLVNGSMGMVAQAGKGNVAGVGTNAMNMAMLRPDAPMSNGYNASSSFLSERKPYLVIERPQAQFSKNYPSEMGLPLNVTRKLSTVHGFTTIDNPVLNIACSDEEYKELIDLLKKGVILP